MSMEILGWLISFLAAMGGIVIGSVINYFILRKLFRQQSMSIMGDLIGKLEEAAKSEQADQVKEILSVVNELLHSKDADEITAEVKRILKSL